MTKFSEPILLSFQDINKIQAEKKEAVAICQCPFPILKTGQWVHVVNYNKNYICPDCNTEFSVFKGGIETYEVKKGDNKWKR